MKAPSETTKDLDKLTGYEGTIQGGALDTALDEQREVLWLARSIVDSVAGSLSDKFGTDWPAKFPDWPRALSGASRMIEKASGELEAAVLEDRALELARADLAASRVQS